MAVLQFSPGGGTLRGTRFATKASFRQTRLGLAWPGCEHLETPHQATDGRAMAPQIDPERLLSDLRTLRSFGACGKGVVRQSFSDIDMAARRWLAGRIA